MNALGADISFYQDDNTTPRKVDFGKMKSSGASFVIIRAGQNLWVDPDFGDFWYGAKAAGLPRGSYWFYDSRIDPVTQAQLWLKTLGSDQGELPMFLDIEYNYGGDFWGAENWKAMLEYIKLKTRHELGIYTAYYVWRDNVPSAARPYFGQYPLWAAHYGVSAPLVPPGWIDWTFWQFTSTGDGAFYGVESKGIDLNYFHGDEAALRARFGLDGGTQPPPVEPPAQATQQGVVIVTALNVRSGPSVGYPVVDVLLETETAFGNVDPATGWMHISQVRRLSGALESLDGWSNASAVYMRVSAIGGETPPPSGGNMEAVYENGVRILTGRMFESDYRVIVVPPAAIRAATLWKPKDVKVTTVENVSGDIVFNWSPFDTAGNPNLGLKIAGTVYRSYVDFNPWLAWTASMQCFIDHTRTGFNAQSTAGQGFRYVIEAGIKNPRASADWGNLEPRRLVGNTITGHTVIITVKGRSTQNRGITLHEAYDLVTALNLAMWMLVDGDSGGSTQDYAVIDGQRELWRGTDEVRAVPVYGIIKLNAPLTTPVTPPPVDPPTEILSFTLSVEGYETFTGELVPNAP